MKLNLPAMGMLGLGGMGVPSPSGGATMGMSDPKQQIMMAMLGPLLGKAMGGMGGGGGQMPKESSPLDIFGMPLR